MKLQVWPIFMSIILFLLTSKSITYLATAQAVGYSPEGIVTVQSIPIEHANVPLQQQVPQDSYLLVEEQHFSQQRQQQHFQNQPQHQQVQQQNQHQQNQLDLHRRQEEQKYLHQQQHFFQQQQVPQLQYYQQQYLSLHQFMKTSDSGVYTYHHHEEHHHILFGGQLEHHDGHDLEVDSPIEPVDFCYSKTTSILTQSPQSSSEHICVTSSSSSAPPQQPPSTSSSLDDTTRADSSGNVPNLSQLVNKPSHNSNIESYLLAPHQYPYDSSLLGAIRHYWREVSGLCLASAIFLNWLFVVIKRRFSAGLSHNNDQQATEAIHQTTTRSVSKDTNSSSLHDSAFEETASPLGIEDDNESSSKSTASTRDGSSSGGQPLNCSSDIRQRSSTLKAEPIPIPTTPNAFNNSLQPPSLSNSLNTSDYFSRYSSDFESIQRLGRGGFGIVFEAKNKIDDCHYAVKRICLPLENEARERVMREVRALAKLDHAGIVRYYNAWLETPPDEWLKQHDAQLGILHSKDGMSFPSTDGLYDRNESDLNTKNGTGGGSSGKLGESGDSANLFGNNPFIRYKNCYRRLLKNDSSSPSLDIVFEGSGSIRLESENSCHETHSTSGKDDSSGTRFFQSGGQLMFGDEERSDNNSDSEDSDFIQFGLKGNNEHKNKKNEDNIISSIHLTDPFSSSDSELDRKEEQDGLHKKRDLRFRKREELSKRAFLPQSKASKVEANRRKALLYQSELRKNQQLNNVTLVENLHVEKVYLYIQMQLCRKDTLKDWLKTNCEQRDKTTIFDLFYQIVDAVEYVHSQDLIHRDLKPSNIFFSLDGTLKIGDFGLCRAKTSAGIGSSLDLNEYVAESDVERGFEAVHTEQVGTQLYMSPEQLNGLSYNQKVDIFAMGLILLELLVPFKTQMQRVNVLFKARNNLYSDEFQLDHPKEHDLVKSLLNRCPQKRPTATEIKQHELLASAQLSQPVIERIYHRRRTISSNSSTE